MRLGSWRFCPGRASTIAVLLLLPVLLALGCWQLDRAAQKAELQTSFAKRFAQPPVDLAGIDPADSSNRYLHVVASGRYDGAHQLLLDNQVHDGQPGYQVLTPRRKRYPDRPWLGAAGRVPASVAGYRNVHGRHNRRWLASTARVPRLALGRCGWS